MEQLPSNQQSKLLVLLDPDQLLGMAEMLDDEGEEPVAVEGVALSDIQQQQLLIIVLLY